MSARSIALRIEMALLNCSHIVAVYTDATPGSTWVPYEFGRVKEPVLSSIQCCSWVYIRKPGTVKPEWLELNEQWMDEDSLVKWLDHEYATWGSGLYTPAGNWKGGTTKPLP